MELTQQELDATQTDTRVQEEEQTELLQLVDELDSTIDVKDETIAKQIPNTSKNLIDDDDDN